MTDSKFFPQQTHDVALAIQGPSPSFRGGSSGGCASSSSTSAATHTNGNGLEGWECAKAANASPLRDPNEESTRRLCGSKMSMTRGCPRLRVGAVNMTAGDSHRRREANIVNRLAARLLFVLGPLQYRGGRRRRRGVVWLVMLCPLVHLKNGPKTY